jgi:lipopolysaccharide biosynthesis glycosyltransferase
MNIVLSTDNNFVPHCATTIMSIIKNNTSNLYFYILTEGLNDENSNILRKIVIDNHCEINYIKVQNNLLNRCIMPNSNTLSHISIATYYRLFIADLLPENVNKVIYFDCDIIVRNSLTDLWNEDISDYAIGSVYHLCTKNFTEPKRLGYPVEYGYFNAGVLLINLDYWRSNHITEKLLTYLEKNCQNVFYHDQDVLNSVLYDQCKWLPFKWNMMTSFFQKDIFSQKLNDQKEFHQPFYIEGKIEMRREINNPSVIHFVARPKPWNQGCVHPYRMEYFKYLKMTPFMNRFHPDKSLRNLIKILYYVVLQNLPFLHVGFIKIKYKE